MKMHAAVLAAFVYITGNALKVQEQGPYNFPKPITPNFWKNVMGGQNGQKKEENAGVVSEAEAAASQKATKIRQEAEQQEEAVAAVKEAEEALAKARAAEAASEEAVRMAGGSAEAMTGGSTEATAGGSKADNTWRASGRPLDDWQSSVAAVTKAVKKVVPSKVPVPTAEDEDGEGLEASDGKIPEPFIGTGIFDMFGRQIPMPSASDPMPMNSWPKPPKMPKPMAMGKPPKGAWWR